MAESLSSEQKAHHQANPTCKGRVSDGACELCGWEPSESSLTLDELAKLLDRENGWDDSTIEILPNGEIRAKKGDGTPKVLTMRENLGGEYAR